MKIRQMIVKDKCGYSEKKNFSFKTKLYIVPEEKIVLQRKIGILFKS